MAKHIIQTPIPSWEKENRYVYTLAHDDGTVFYVGKGTGDRAISHIRQACKNGDTRVCSMIRSIWSQGGKVIIRKPYNLVNDKEALRLERELINHYGYNQLVNIPTITVFKQMFLQVAR